LDLADIPSGPAPATPIHPPVAFGKGHAFLLSVSTKRVGETARASDDLPGAQRLRRF